MSSGMPMRVAELMGGIYQILLFERRAGGIVIEGYVGSVVCNEPDERCLRNPGIRHLGQECLAGRDCHHTRELVCRYGRERVKLVVQRAPIVDSDLVPPPEGPLRRR